MMCCARQPLSRSCNQKNTNVFFWLHDRSGWRAQHIIRWKTCFPWFFIFYGLFHDFLFFTTPFLRHVFHWNHHYNLDNFSTPKFCSFLSTNLIQFEVWVWSVSTFLVSKRTRRQKKSLLLLTIDNKFDVSSNFFLLLVCYYLNN